MNARQRLACMLAAAAWAALLNPFAWAGACQKDSSDPACLPPFAVPAVLESFPGGWNYREKWHRVSDAKLSGMHWSHFVVVYVNRNPEIYRQNHYEYRRLYLENDDLDFEEMDEPEFAHYPVGTVILKENYWPLEGKVGPAHSLSIMVKREPGFASEYGDWEYLETESKGKVTLSGSAQNRDVLLRCGNCHSSVQERDFVFSTEFLDE